MSDSQSLGDRIKRAVTGRQAASAPSGAQVGVAAGPSLSESDTASLKSSLAEGDPIAGETMTRIATLTNPHDPDQLELLVETARRIATTDDEVAARSFLDLLAARPTGAALSLIECAKAFAEVGSPVAQEYASAAAKASPSDIPIACESAAIALRFSGPVASLRTIRAHVTAAGDPALASPDVARHATWAAERLGGRAAANDWHGVAETVSASAFDGLDPWPGDLQAWTQLLLLLESWGEGQVTLDQAEARVVALALERTRAELVAGGGRPRAPVADILRASKHMEPATLAAFAELLSKLGARSEAVALGSQLRGSPHEISALIIQAEHAPDRWQDRILPRWIQATEAYADDPQVQFRSGTALIERGEVDYAVKALQRAFDLDPASAAHALALGGAHEVRQDWAEALAVYERASDAGADDWRLMRKRASMLLELGLPEQATGLLQDAASPDSDPETFVTYIWALERSGRAAEAARLVAIAGIGDDAPNLLVETAVRVMAITLLKAGRAYADPRMLETATALAFRFIDRLPAPRVWELVQAAMELGRDEMALAVLAAALTGRPDPLTCDDEACAAMLHRVSTTSLQGDLSRFSQAASPTIPQTLAMALELQGRAAAATLMLAAAALTDPDNEGLALAAGALLVRHDHLAAAEAMFARCNRAYEDSCRNFIWPRSDAGRWPKGGGPTPGAFDALLPEGAQWPRITVVTPSYNQADFVEETVLSVLNQHYPNLQYIVVDGGSTDGAAEILERYRDKVDVLIIEPDKGQTDAINKGFALADGELMTWLNSDDMFAPGALHRIALEYLDSKADIIAGICVAYRDGRVEVANLPAVRQETFTVEVMADIFRYWMKGYFFYQPEVVFSRAIWEKTGGRLNDDLNYTMDYEFWMRCAQADARFEVVHWPVALFRQHEAQKTSRLLHCVDEQAVVRDETLAIAPSDERRRELITGARQRLRGEKVKVAVYTSRYDKIFSPLMEAELAQRFQDSGMSVRLFTSPDELPVDDDFIVWLVHLQADDYAIDAYRQRGGKAQIIGWFWDNHHHLFPNRDVVERLDYWSAGHAFVSHYLTNDRALRLEPTPLSVSQWSRQEAEIFYREAGQTERSDTLYGGFVRYAFAEKRNALIEELMQAGEEGVYFLEEADARRYFDRSRRSRFAEWASHKASLCLPLDGDLSQRLFDALLTGQVPIAPRDIADLDAVIPPALQKKLPIVRFDKYRPADVKAAHAKAIKLFDEGGPEAALARHRMAVESHMFSDRIAALLDQVRALADAR